MLEPHPQNAEGVANEGSTNKHSDDDDNNKRKKINEKNQQPS